MSEPFIAEIRIFAGNFAPRSWAFCDGQILPISQNTALFSLIGTTYGGDGRTSMGLPNLQGRCPMHPGRGPGLTARRLGEVGGTPTVTLSEAQMPDHNHAPQGSGDPANQRGPSGNLPAVGVGRGAVAYSASGSTTGFERLGSAGGGQAHNNLQPYLGLNFIIALQGLYPSRG